MIFRALYGRLRLFWHCLLRLHRSEELTAGFRIIGIYIPLLTVRLECHECEKVFYDVEEDV